MQERITKNTVRYDSWRTANSPVEQVYISKDSLEKLLPFEFADFPRGVRITIEAVEISEQDWQLWKAEQARREQERERRRRS